MVANGFAPAAGVITTSIGHSWSVTFGSLAAPAKIVVGCSTVGLGGRERPVLRAGVRYGLVIAAALGGAALLWTALV